MNSFSETWLKALTSTHHLPTAPRKKYIMSYLHSTSSVFQYAFTSASAELHFSLDMLIVMPRAHCNVPIFVA